MILTAYAYAAKGMPLFPCHNITLHGRCSCGRLDCGSPGKHPRTKSGVLDATADPRQIQMWWSSWPIANIGLATGTPSGYYLVDLDGEAGVSDWQQKTSEHGEAPTLMARTGGGGIHLYYELPAGVDLPNTAKKLSPYIDTRGSGGYVLMPPSNHKSGRKYEWIGGSPALLPQWVLDIVKDQPVTAPELRKHAPPTRPRSDDSLALRILDEECRRVASAPEGERNHTLFRSACSMFEIAYGGELRQDTVYDDMLAAATSAGLRPYEIAATLESAAKHGRDAPRRIRTRLEAG